MEKKSEQIAEIIRELQNMEEAQKNVDVIFQENKPQSVKTNVPAETQK